jgi:hypothetical protein
MNAGSFSLRNPEDKSIQPEEWFQLMRKGKFEEAWEYNDKVLKSGANRDYHYLPRHYQCIWDGTPLNGKKVLIRCYHGLGDTIQFIRYTGLVKEIATKVIVWAQPKLIPVLKTMEGIDQLLPLHDGAPEANYDVDVEIMELPHVFRTTLSTIPQKMPYINIEPLLFERKTNEFLLGLVWQAGDWDPSRSVPFFLFKPLFKMKNIKIYILQDNPFSSGWIEGFGIYPRNCTLYDHARIIKGLDLLISIDSMPAHLAGAMNIPVWLMLQKEPDWRWMENRNDSPWYPSMKIFRQEKQGNWFQLISQIVDELTRIQDQNSC